MSEPSSNIDKAPLMVEDDAPDSIEAVAATVAYLRASWRNRTKEDVDSELDRIASRLMDLADSGTRVLNDLAAHLKQELGMGGVQPHKLEIPFTLTYFREARDIGRQWARERYEQETVHLRVSAIFDASWAESNARMLLGIDLDDYAKDRESYEHAMRWIRDLSTVIARAASREYKKLAEGQMR